MDNFSESILPVSHITGSWPPINSNKGPKHMLAVLVLQPGKPLLASVRQDRQTMLSGREGPQTVSFPTSLNGCYPLLTGSIFVPFLQVFRKRTVGNISAGIVGQRPSKHFWETLPTNPQNAQKHDRRYRWRCLQDYVNGRVRRLHLRSLLIQHVIRHLQLIDTV